MKKILCMLVLTAISVAHAMVPRESATQAAPAIMMTPLSATEAAPAISDINKIAAAHFQKTPPAMPEQHPTIQTMHTLDAQCMVHPDVAAKHMKMIHEAYAAGHMSGYNTGMKQAGQYMQSCLNSMASTMTPARTK